MLMHPFIAAQKEPFQAALDHLSKDLASLRTGRASIMMFEDIPVSAYGGTMELKGLASLGTQDARTIVIEPWDKTMLPVIEKAIRDADLGVSPAVDGQKVRVVMPPMTEENRKTLARNVKDRVEETRVSVRHVREEVREQILQKEKDKEIGEDDKYKLLEELDELTKEFTKKAEEMGDKKEQEIMTV